MFLSFCPSAPAVLSPGEAHADVSWLTGGTWRPQKSGIPPMGPGQSKWGKNDVHTKQDTRYLQFWSSP